METAGYCLTILICFDLKPHVPMPDRGLSRYLIIAIGRPLLAPTLAVKPHLPEEDFERAIRDQVSPGGPDWENSINPGTSRNDD